MTITQGIGCDGSAIAVASVVEGVGVGEGEWREWRQEESGVRDGEGVPTFYLGHGDGLLAVLWRGHPRVGLR